MIITQGTPCSTEWSPGEGLSGIPEIRYSTNTTANGFLIYGQYSDTNENEIADTMVVYINYETVTSTPTFVPTDVPTNIPSSSPSSSPSLEPSDIPSLLPTRDPTGIYIYILRQSCVF